MTHRATKGGSSLRHHDLPFVVVIAGLSALFAWEFAEVAFRVMLGGEIISRDADIYAAVFALRTPILTRFFWAATILGDPWFLTAAATAVAMLLFVWGKRRAAWLFSAALAVGSAMQTALKHVFDRTRPADFPPLITRLDSYSFPSGHAFASLVFAGLVAFILWRTLHRPAARAAVVVLAALAAAVVGISRIYLGVHWASDVVASWWLGLSWLTATIGAYVVAYRRGLLDMPQLPAPTQPKSRTVRSLAIASAALVIGAAFVAVALGDPIAVGW